MNLDQMAGRFRRVVTPPPTAPASTPDPEPAPRAATRVAPAPGPHTPPPALHPGSAAGPSSPAAGRPKRRRWRPAGVPAERDRPGPTNQPTLYVCPVCGERHQPFPMPSSRGLAAYGADLLDDLTRPTPLGHQALVARDRNHPRRN